MAVSKFTDADLLKRLRAALEGLDKAGVIVDRDTAQFQKDLACYEARQALEIVRAERPELLLLITELAAMN